MRIEKKKMLREINKGRKEKMQAQKEDILKFGSDYFSRFLVQIQEDQLDSDSSVWEEAWNILDEDDGLKINIVSFYSP